MFDKRFAAFVYILPGGFKVTCVPGVGDVALFIGEVEKADYLAVGVRAENTVHIADVCRVHTYEEVVFFIIPACELNCLATGVFYSVFIKCAASARVNIVTDFLG